MDHRIWQGLVLRKAVCIVWILRVVASYPEVVAERAVDLCMDRSVPRLCARTRRSSRIQVVLCHVACLPKVPTKPTAASTRSTCLAGECICPEIDQGGDRNLGISDWGKRHTDAYTQNRFFCSMLFVRVFVLCFAWPCSCVPHQAAPSS